MTVPAAKNGPVRRSGILIGRGPLFFGRSSRAAHHKAPPSFLFHLFLYIPLRARLRPSYHLGPPHPAKRPTLFTTQHRQSPACDSRPRRRHLSARHPHSTFFNLFHQILDASLITSPTLHLHSLLVHLHTNSQATIGFYYHPSRYGTHSTTYEAPKGGLSVARRGTLLSRQLRLASRILASSSPSSTPCLGRIIDLNTSIIYVL